MNIHDIVKTKAAGRRNSEAELRFVADSAADGSLSDEDLTSWLKAAFENPMSPQETAELTMAMAESGERMDLTSLPKPWIDKHSTGGVGDKTTLVLLPLLAACGLTVVKMSGRGLGTTGGTIDKLESVPGFRTDLSPEELLDQASKIGVAITGQTPRLAPADKKLYALRDVTGTVGSVPLIVSSILSKKIAGGAETVVLDVKCGSGAFMKTLPAARELALALQATGQLCNLNLYISITEMDQPLGRAVGNALEVKEAIRLLKGEEKGRFYDLCVHFGATALVATGAGTEQDVRAALDSGAALNKAREWFGAQGADLAVFETEDWCCHSSVTQIFNEGDAGWVGRIDAQSIGQAVVEMGGGRMQKGDDIDASVGIVLNAEVGEHVEHGQHLATVHGSGAEQKVAESIEVTRQSVDRKPVVLVSL